MTQPLPELVDHFCVQQHKQRGRTEGGTRTYRWNLEQFLEFVRKRESRLARVKDLTASTVQGWMDHMASADLALSTMRARQSTLSSLCAWLVKRGLLPSNPVAQLDRPPHRREAPKGVPTPALMDALIQATKERHRPRDLAIFLILRYTGMRRESVVTLRARNLDPEWGLRNVRVKGGKTRDIPLPQAVTQFLMFYVDRHLPTLLQPVTPDTPLFWSSWGQRRQGRIHRPITGKTIWRLCKTYGRIIGQPMSATRESIPRRRTRRSDPRNSSERSSSTRGRRWTY